MKTHFASLAILIFVACFCLRATSQDKNGSQITPPQLEKPNTVANSIANSSDKIRISIEAKNGKVSWAKIADAVAKQAGVEIPAIKRIPSGGELDIKAPATRWILVGVNLALQPAIRISARRRTESVVIEIDKTEIEHARKKWGARLRHVKTAADAAKGETFGIVPYDATKKLENAKQIAIIVHGFNSSPKQFQPLASKIESPQTRSEAIRTASFHYSTRKGVANAAREFEKHLKQLVQKNPDCEITLITHSMGGIVSRLVIEKDNFELPQIKQIIMVAPPNKGSNLALLPIGTDRFDPVLARIDRTKIRDTLRQLVAEVNLAVEDLRPKSELMKKLDKQKRNPNIDYSIILGNKAVLTATQAQVLKTFSKQMKTAKQKHVVKGGQEIAEVLAKLSQELVSPQGDGVVGLNSGKLRGVDDVVVLKFKHNDISTKDSKEQAAIYAEILKRIRSQ